MTSTDVFALQRSNLNGFLFADVGTEHGGNRLSVLSALARIGLDPWQEASRLSGLPRAGAVGALVSTLEKFSSDVEVPFDPDEVAVMLVALLPCHRVELGRLPLVPNGPVRKIFSVNLASVFLGVVVYCIVLLLLDSSGVRGSDIGHGLRHGNAGGHGRPATDIASAPTLPAVVHSSNSRR